MFLRNKSLLVKVLSDKKAETMPSWEEALNKAGSGVTFTMSPEQVSEAASEFITKTAVTVGIVYSGIRVLNTICKVVEIAAKSKLK